MKRLLTEVAQFETLRFDDRGLLPAVVQDAVTKEVLMVAYMNQEALMKTLATKETWFYSRSREELWHKGATSTHTQHVVSLAIDCDADTLLVLVQPQGPACHTGAISCFDETDGDREKGATSVDPMTILLHLESLIEQRDRLRPEGAYTTYLFEKGIDKILKKVGEETAEVIIGAKNRNPDEVRYEVADLFYHLLVMLREQGIRIEEVMAELASRYTK
jgi:phosphoribosyl-ATP pyrophosphohydrolase/phosphoribosyl-AMP cyclohydrolase